MLPLSESNVHEGINYAIPVQWWKKFKQSSHFQSQEFKPSFGSSSLANIDTYPIIDTMLVDYEQYIVSELSQKSNKLYISQKFMSPMLSPDKQIFEDYILVSGPFYNKLKQHFRINHHVMGFAFKEYEFSGVEKVDKVNGLYCPRAQIQIQIIFCTNKSGFLFVGFFPEDGNFLELVRMVIKEMGFIERNETRMIFLEENAETTIRFSHLPTRRTRELNSQQKFIMVTNLLSENEPMMTMGGDQLNLSVESTKNNANNMENILERLFDEDNEVEHLNHKTISTGASTPLDYSMNSQYRNEMNEYVVKAMLKEKSQEQIQHLRVLADHNTEGQLIRVNTSNKMEKMIVNLEILAEEIDEFVNMNRKKIKDKGN